VTLRLTGVRHAVIVAPHPDDEVIGAAALILALRRHGARVTVVVVSDGAASHPASRRWPAKRLVAARRRESLMALRRLAVAAGDVRFLGLPDGALPELLTHCRRRVRRAIRLAAGVDLIVGPDAGDAHPDHRAVAAALAGGFGRVRRLAYQVWPPRAGLGSQQATIAMRGGHPAKRSLIRLHRTQLGAITDDPAGFAIARHELAAFAHPIETFIEERR
jgi:LmbE family N-acetylglucosaminyl deacetylase